VDLPAYDRIGRGYSRHRAADPRIVGRLAQLLGPPENGAVVDVGAGTGNYAALAGRGYRVVAVEPSATMRDQAERSPLPHDLQDGFAAAGWRRPETYLDAGARSAMSCFALADRSVVEDGLNRLSRDLDSGAWRERHGSVLDREEFDAGYRFLSVGRVS
jgi:SAM-dependent methyltransferase